MIKLYTTRLRGISKNGDYLFQWAWQLSLGEVVNPFRDFDITAPVSIGQYCCIIVEGKIFSFVNPTTSQEIKRVLKLQDNFYRHTDNSFELQGRHLCTS